MVVVRPEDALLCRTPSCGPSLVVVTAAGLGVPEKRLQTNAQRRTRYAKMVAMKPWLQAGGLGLYQPKQLPLQTE